MIGVIFVFAFIAVVVLVKAIVLVPEKQSYIPARLGKALEPIGPGLHVLVPFIDAIAARYSLAEQSAKISDTFVSADGTNVPVEMTARFRILDPAKAYHNISNVENALQQLLINALKGEVARRKSDDLRFDRRSIESEVARVVDEASEHFGVKILDCTLQ